MQKAEDYYGDKTYPEMLATWSAKYGSADYKPHELEAIHRRWKSLGKRVSHGAQVSLETRRRKGAR